MENTKFIKLFDERIANALSDGGFSYIEEKVNGNQTVYQERISGCRYHSLDW